MLAIRLNRFGKRNRAHFRVVVQEHTEAPGGRHLELLGNYNPHLKKGAFKAERIKYWISKGAQVSDSLHNLLIKEGIIEGKKRAIKISKKVVETKEEPTKKEESKEKKAGETVPAEGKEHLAEAKPEKKPVPAEKEVKKEEKEEKKK